MKILLTGKSGQLGRELQPLLATLGEVMAVDRAAMDLANPDSIRSIIRQYKPHLIVNAAAYTTVDQAEDEPELAMKINGVAPGIMAEETKKTGGVIVHFSTDYVFDGGKKAPYVEDDLPNPINMYGVTKLAGEHALQAMQVPHLIFRTSWLYGQTDNNFVQKIIRLAEKENRLSVIDDQIGTPNWARTIACSTSYALTALFSKEEKNLALPRNIWGVFHLSADGETSRLDFAKTIIELETNRRKRVGLRPLLVQKISPVKTTEYASKAKRPAYSKLSNQKFSEAFNFKNAAWQEDLNQYLAESFN